MSAIEQKRQSLAIEAWHLMGSELDLSQLDIVVERLGIDDVDLLITHLEAIRDHLARQAEAARG